MSGSAYDCVVIGGGIVGAATARALAARGNRILLLERAMPGAEASGAAAGMLTPQVEVLPDDPLLPLAIAARERYRALVPELDRRTGVNVGYVGGGSVQVALADGEAEPLRSQGEAQLAVGLRAEWLDRRALERRHPGIAPAAKGALLAPDDARVNNVALTAALLADAVRHGAEIADHEEATEIVIAAGRVTAVVTRGRRYGTGGAVVAGGAWSGALRGLPRPLPVEPIRGQMAVVTWPAGEPPGVMFGSHVYIVPRGDDALLGSTMESAGFAKDTTPGGLGAIFTGTAALLPAIAAQRIHRSWAGLRPVTPDGRPLIGPDPEVAGLWYATGHGRKGILLGPLTGEIVRDLVVDGSTSWDIRPCDVTRFDPRS
ncbi:MAG TPA: glycine oxidase ThiO [Gemmatimonadales bacterium]|nr:glycine oxidase ThiO [Gemmatimonadales bacterium]